MATTPSGALQSIADKQEITEVLHRYCRAIDRGDLDLLKAVFCDDATVNYGVFKGRVADTLFQSAGNSPWKAMQHTVSTILIEIDGDRALSEASFFAWIYREDADGAFDEWTAGRYIDRFERREGAWRIAHRDVVHSWSRSEPKGIRTWERGPMKSTPTLSRRDSGDPLYAALAKFRS